MLSARVKGRRNKGARDVKNRIIPKVLQNKADREERVERLRTTVLEEDSWHAMAEDAAFRYQVVQENVAWNQTTSRVKKTQDPSAVE